MNPSAPTPILSPTNAAAPSANALQPLPTATLSLLPVSTSAHSNESGMLQPGTYGSSALPYNSLATLADGLPPNDPRFMIPEYRSSIGSLPGEPGSQIEQINLAQKNGVLQETQNPLDTIKAANALNMQSAQSPQNALNGHAIQSQANTFDVGTVQARQNPQNIMARLPNNNPLTSASSPGQLVSPGSAGATPTTPSSTGYAGPLVQPSVWGTAMPSPGSDSTGSRLFGTPSVSGTGQLSLFDPDNPHPDGYKKDPNLLITQADREEAARKQREAYEKARQEYRAKQEQQEKEKQAGVNSPGSANMSLSSTSGKSSGSNESGAQRSTASSSSGESSKASSTGSGSSSTGSGRRPGPLRRLFQRIFFGRARRRKPLASQGDSAGGSKPKEGKDKRRVSRIRRFLKWLVSSLPVVEADLTDFCVERHSEETMRHKSDSGIPSGARCDVKFGIEDMIVKARNLTFSLRKHML